MKKLLTTLALTLGLLFGGMALMAPAANDRLQRVADRRAATIKRLRAALAAARA